LDSITDLKGWTIVATPLKIVNGDGCPIRVCIFK
jgi:kynurenine formamidase